MLCAKYQEAGMCGSREKCDRNYLVSKFAYVHNIQSGSQTGSGHAADSKLGYTIQFSILMLCAKYKKNVTEIFCDTDDDARRPIVIPICRLR